MFENHTKDDLRKFINDYGCGKLITAHMKNAHLQYLCNLITRYSENNIILSDKINTSIVKKAKIISANTDMTIKWEQHLNEKGWVCLDFLTNEELYETMKKIEEYVKVGCNY